MQDIDLMQLALQLPKEWYVEECDFDEEKGRLNIKLNFRRGEMFCCTDCHGQKYKIHDTVDKTWRHMNFFQHEAYITARVPRTKCDRHGVKMIDIPWARKGSGFTLLFEALLMTLSKSMPVDKVARFVGEHDTKIWRVLKHYVGEAREKLDFSALKQIGIDETSSKKGHNYITVFVDMETSTVAYATEGKNAETINSFVTDLQAHGGAPENISEVSIDMSPAFISGAEDFLPDADITFDKFHVMKKVNEAVSDVRREEAKHQDILTKTRYLWLKNRDKLTKKQEATLNDILALRNMNLKTVRAYKIKLAFQELFKQPADVAEEYLKKWYFWATHSRIAPIIEAAKTVKSHWDGILRWFDSGLTNGVVEGINGEIQEIKARARGFRNINNFITMIYLKLGGIMIPEIHLK
jgi:transposase